MRNSLSNSLLKQVVNFANFYHQYRVESEKLTSIKYRMVTTIEEYKKYNLIQLAFTDNPGDLLAPVTIEKIKLTPDIISGMHPIDINTINDLYYLDRDKIIEVKIEDENIIALKHNGQIIHYKITDYIDIESIRSPRLSYMVGYMKAEKFIRETYLIKDKYKIIADNITSLKVLDLESNHCFLKNPLDILFSDDYKNFSKEDVSRIGYICGQMAKL